MLDMVAIGRFYRWLYYRCYRYSQNADGKYASLNWANASAYVCIIFAMNFVALFLLSVVVFGSWFPLGIPRQVIFGVPVAIALGHTLYWRKRYKHVLIEFSSETSSQQRYGDRLFGFYLVGSLVLMILAFGLLALLSGLR